MPDRFSAIDAHIPGLRRFARALSRGDPEAADDLVQDTLERAVSAWERRKQDTNPRAWLHTILYNRFCTDRSRLRRRVLHQNLDAVSERQLPSYAGGQESALMYRDLVRGFMELPEEQRSVIFLTVVEDLSYEEIARILGVPIGTVMSRLFRGREKLRKYMEGDQQLARKNLERMK